jgi:hypothetical protein
MDKVRIKAPAKQAKGSENGAAKSNVKSGAKRNVDKALGKGKGALGSKKDKLSNDFST